MKQLFLTSSVNFVAHDIAKRVDLSVGNKLVFITTAAEPDMDHDITWLYNDRQSLVDVGFTVTDYTITGKTLEQLKTDLPQYDYIYLSGGNTLHLLQESQKSGFIDYIHDLIEKQGKTYIGCSAGSIITGPKCPDYLLEENDTIETTTTEGYGFVNFTVLPHWGSDDFRELYLGGRLKIAYKKDQVPLLALTDTQYVHIRDKEVEIVDVATPLASV